MNLKKVLSLTLLQLRNLFENQFPFLIPIANQSESEEIFKELLRLKLKSFIKIIKLPVGGIKFIK